MRRYLSLISLFLVAFTALLAGCAPPPKGGSGGNVDMSTSAPKIAGSGKEIVNLNPRRRNAFRTVLVNGAEMLEARGDVGKFGGTFYENSIGEGPKTFNPLASMDATSTAMAGMLFSSLGTTDAYTGDVVPYMAKTIEVKPDKLTYVVTLRKGLQWSDGQPITAKDVVFTWNQIIKPGFGNASNRDVVLVDGKFPEVTQVDDLTVQFKTAKPFSPFLRVMSGSTVMPEHILKNVVTKGNQAFSSFWGVEDAAKNPKKIVGNGMWLLDRYDTRQRAIFKRNPRFFMVDKQGQRLPYLDSYVYSFVTDLNNQELQFEQGKADTYDVPASFVSRVRQLTRPDFKLYNLGPTTGTSFMAFNLSKRKGDNGKAQVDPVKAAWFNDVNFRQAINHTINREDLVANILKGVGAPLFTAESLSSIYLNKSLAGGFQPDVNYAKELLKKSGFKWDAKGQLQDKQGHPVRFTLLTNSGNNEREATGVNIKQDLAALGMTVDFKPIDFNVLVDKTRDGSWETMILGLTGGKLEPHEGANVWKSDGSLHLFNQRSIKEGKKTDVSDRLPWEQQIDEDFEKGSQVFPFEERKKFYDDYQKVVYEQVPMIYLYSPLAIVAVRDHIRNFDPTPLGTFHNLEEIWLDDAGKK